MWRNQSQPPVNKTTDNKTTNNMKSFRFFEWKVYKDSQCIFSKALKIVDLLPQRYRYDMGSQLLRSSLSISLNIAEGCGKYSDKEFNRFIEISLGSLYETVACLDILRKEKFISSSCFDEVLILCDEVAKQLGGFKKKLVKA